MFKSLYFKVILILVIFIIAVMSVVGAVLLSSVYNFYIEDFTAQMENNLSENSQLYIYLTEAMQGDESSYVARQKSILQSYSSKLGIDDYRNFYILDENGEFLDGSDSLLGTSLTVTPNLLAAQSGGRNRQNSGADYTDYAIKLENGGRSCIIYIKDTQEELSQISRMLFSIILQSLFIGLLIAVVLSFFLAKAITSPLLGLTRGVQLVAKGDFSHKIDIHSNDEIGALTDNFNKMSEVLRETLDEISGERTKLETVFSCLRDGVIAFTEDGRVLNINDSAICLLGENYDDGFSLGKLFETFTFNNDLKENLGKSDEYTVPDVIYGDRVLELNFGNIRYREGKNMRHGNVVIIHDVTQRYELDKSRREFVANVSHELRTPLTSIKGACETMLAYDNIPPDMRKNFLTMAVNESDRMTRIVQDLLVLSRLDSNRTRWQICDFEINSVLSNLCDVMRPIADEKKQTISFTPTGDDFVITADKERIEQVIINIVSNSIKYTGEGGHIDILAQSEKNRVTVKIKDNGIGIPKEDIPRLFERFYRVEKARSTEAGGTGLGLAIAREIVQAHGGSINVKSKLDVGTEMTVVLPKKTKLESTI